MTSWGLAGREGLGKCLVCWMRPTRTSFTRSRTPSPTRHGSCSGRSPMSEALRLEKLYPHVRRRDLFAPIVVWFESAIRAGRENSVILGEHTQGVPPAAAASL